MNVLITGATSGIGKQLALDYLNDGHQVWAVGRNPEVLDELERQGFQVGQVDLSDREKSLAWFSSLPGVDLAILNAGSCEYVDVKHFDSRLFERVMRANFTSMAVSLEGVLPLLRKGNRPHLVGVGSAAAYLPLTRAEAYGASKAAVAYLFNTLRIDLYRENIDVSLVSPGFVKTPLTDKNDFPMPFRIGVEAASQNIRRGIARRKAEIHFPKRFTFLLKTLAFIPDRIWTRISQKTVRNEQS